MMPVSFLQCCIIIILLSFSLPRPALAGMEEFKIKAAMIYNFTKYVEWPASGLPTGNPLNVCITGSSTLRQHLDQLQGKQVNGRTISVRFIMLPIEISGCNLLFIDRSEQHRLPSFVQQANRKPILTVSDIDQFTIHGGMIGFVEQDDKIRFEINQENASQAGINISSKLLKLARVVKGSK